MPVLQCLLLVVACAAQPPGLALSYGEVRDKKFGDVGVAVLSYEQPVLQLSRRWRLGYMADAGAVFERGSEESRGALLSVGPSLHFEHRVAELSFSIEMATRPAWLSQNVFNARSLGTHFHFASHIGFVVKPTRLPLFTAFRYMHMSNAGIGDPNPGMDLAIFSLGIRFASGN